MRIILFSVSSIPLVAVTSFAKEPIRTWTSVDGKSQQAEYISSSSDTVKIRIKTKEYTLPISRFSTADQEYIKKAFERSLFMEPKPFEGKGRGGVIVASAKGRVEVLVPPRDSYSKVRSKARAVIVGESIA